MLPIRPSRAVAVAVAVLAIACGDLTRPQATFMSTPNSYALYAFTGAPVNGGTAITFLSSLPSRADAAYAFDVAFDLDSAGHPIIYPVRAIASDLAGGVKRVGLQVVPGPFDAVREVPQVGYDTLSAKTVNVGDVLAIEMLELNSCLYSRGGQSLYAKLTVDSVNTTTRRLYARTVIDPNCGYRQVVPDSIPTN